ncbi:MAG: hypothetical protein EPN75_08895 [Beijerinckiaceae bacterium]|nr:MAG: hypothetical protein EPN75_08895 [Beijerinckiaceae bacterium]
MEESFKDFEIEPKAMDEDLRDKAIAKCREALEAAREAGAGAAVYMIEMALVELDTNPDLPRKKPRPISYDRHRPIGR